MEIRDLLLLSPEIIVLLSAIFILVFGLFRDFAKSSWWISSIFIFLMIIIINNYDFVQGTSHYLGLYIDSEIIFYKGILGFITIFLIFFYAGFARHKNISKSNHEYIVLMMLSLLGGMVAVSAQNFLTLFVALEIIALCSYVFAAYDRDKSLSVEAGTKYFILGGLSTSIMVFGISFIYGFSGTLSLPEIEKLLFIGSVSPGLLAGLLIFVIGIFFKLSIAPFHIWTPDIYQGSPLISVAFFSSIPKLTSLFVLVHLQKHLFFKLDDKIFIDQILLYLGILSVIIGAFGGIVQKSLKRLIGYSTIMNMGFAILPLASLSQEGANITVMYGLIYSISTIGILALMAITSNSDMEDYQIDYIAGFGKVKKLAALAFSILMFSLAGIPPLAGFFAKYYVILNMVQYGFYIDSVFVLISSVAAAFYYINIVKIIYFSPPGNADLRLYESFTLRFVVALSIVSVIFMSQIILSTL